MNEPKLLRMADAADALSVSRSKIYELAARGEIPTVRVGASLRVPAAALDAWIAERTKAPTAA
jgi:excisionase family DNA binding protein